tara:strand:+ start:65 stop:697 length:633 start_codon:yes stop_codon:yes gene_type:complete
MRLFEITEPRNIPIAQLSRQLTGTQDIEDISMIVQKAFPELNVDSLQNKQIDTNTVNVGAFYDDEEENDITVQLMFSNEDTVTWNTQNRKDFLRRLQSTIKHEYMHADQHAARDYDADSYGSDDSTTSREYYSRGDEIEAYAMNIADELKRKQGVDGAMQTLRTVTKSSQLKDKLGYLLSPDLKGYIDEFDDNPRVIKALLKKIYQFLTK